MKLPKPIQCESSWRITVTFENKRYSARDSAKEWKHWASVRLLELKTGQANLEQGIKPAYPFRQLYDKYYQEYAQHMRSALLLCILFSGCTAYSMLISCP